MTGEVHAANAPSDRLAPVETALRRLRLLIIAALALPLLARPHETLGVASVALATAVAVGLLAVNAATKASSDSTRGATALLLSFAVLTVDAAAIVVIVSEMDLLQDEVAWAFLIIPVLEGAIRFSMRGALLTWLGTSAAYVAMELAVPASMVDPDSQAVFLEQVQTLTYRVGIVLLVAVPAGYLSEQLLGAIEAHREQHSIATSRSSMLVEVVGAGRRLGDLEMDYRSTLVQAALRLGFDRATCRDLDDDRVVTAGQPGTTDDPELRTDVVDETAALAVRSHRVMIIGGPQEDRRVSEALHRHHVETIVVCPIHSHEGSRIVIEAVTLAGRVPTDGEIECLQLLAGQAGVAAGNDVLVGRLHEAQGHLEYQAHHDVLTGLPNRLLFQRRLAAVLEELDDPAHQGEGVSLLFLDLDRFKEINDTLGHDAGDELLVEVAARIQAATRGRDTVARLGGDEFIVLLPSTSEAGAATVAQSICSELAAEAQIAGSSVYVSASIGIVATDEAIDSVELLRRVDLAMYQAKASGRATWRVHSPQLDAAARERAEMQRELRDALYGGQLDAQYQPIVALNDGRVIAVEILARWNHPVKGPIPPDRFISAAENSGLILELGSHMLRKGCERAREFQMLGVDVAVSINVSPHQARRREFADEVMTALSDHGLDTSQIILELTERTVVAEDVVATLTALRERGVRIAIDDFGQGHTSIGSLDRVPADTLKIDRSFVHGVRAGTPQAVILTSMITLGQGLAMSVVAEGVETIEDLVLLETLGCDAVQGYLLHRPMSFDAVLEVLADERDSRGAIRGAPTEVR